MAPSEAVTPAKAGVQALSTGLDSRPTPSRGQALRENDSGKVTLRDFPSKWLHHQFCGSVSISVGIENPAVPSQQGAQHKYGLPLARVQTRLPRPFGTRSDTWEPLSSPTKRATLQIRGVPGPLGPRSRGVGAATGPHGV